MVFIFDIQHMHILPYSTPLLSEIRDSFGLTKTEIWNSIIASFPATGLMRLMMGPVCDKYGPRIPMAIVLCVTAIPVASAGFIQSGFGLTLIRIFSSTGGATFIMTQAST